MTKFMLRLTAALGFAVIAVFSVGLASAGAATGPWTWTDVSSQVAIRANRPVWAVAHAGTFWYFTDGQDLSTTGHVWKTDGKNTSDITIAVRNAGLTHVDSMASNGKTVLLLKNVAQQNRSVEVLAFDGEGYTDRTAEFRAFLQPTEGIRSLSGNDGKTADGWLIVTTANRVLRVANSVPPFTLANDISADYPIASFGTHTVTLETTKAGTQFDVADAGVTQSIILPSALQSIKDWKSVKFAWTGRSWMILNGKDLYRLTGNQLESYGQTRDYFVTMAGDGNGTVYLGGAVSNATTHDSPTNPLTAKLVNVYEASPVSIATANATSYWSWLAPNLTELRRDQSTAWNVGAWNASGLKKIEIFVNWNLRKTCDFGAATGNQTCTVALNGSEYQPNSTVSMIAKITDAKDSVTWTSFTSLAVKDAAYALATNTAINSTQSVVTSNGISVWTWLEPNVSSMNTNGQVTFKAQATASDGLTRIELLVDNVVKKFCDFGRAMGTQSCDITLSGASYTLGATISTAAKATGASGAVSTSATRTIEIRNNLKDAGPNPSTVSTWLSPSKDTLRDGETSTFFAQAQDIDGLDHVDILVNGAVKQTCTYTNAYDARECSFQINASQFPTMQSINVGTRVTDAKGNITWADTKNYTLWH